MLITKDDITYHDSNINDLLINYFRDATINRHKDDIDIITIGLADLALLKILTDGTMTFHQADIRELFPVDLTLKTYGELWIHNVLINKLTVESTKINITNTIAINNLHTDQVIINYGFIQQLNNIVGTYKFINYGVLNADGFNDGAEINFPTHYFRIINKIMS